MLSMMPKEGLNPPSRTRQAIEDILLDFASLYDEVSTSDLQGLAMVAAEKIIKLVKEGAK